MNRRASPIRLDIVYFGNNEQSSLVFFNAHAEHNLIRLDQRKLLIIFRSVLCSEIQANQSNCSPLNTSQSITLNKAHVIEIKAKNSLVVRCTEKRVS